MHLHHWNCHWPSGSGMGGFQDIQQQQQRQNSHFFRAYDTCLQIMVKTEVCNSTKEEKADEEEFCGWNNG